MRTDARYIRAVNTTNPSAWALSLTNVLLVSTPMIDSLNDPVISELVLRTRRALSRMRRWNFSDTHQTTGSTVITRSASRHSMTSMAPVRPIMMVKPQIMSTNPHDRMLVNRSQSAVRRAISQPTGRRSKNENDSFCRFAKASNRMSWLT